MQRNLSISIFGTILSSIMPARVAQLRTSQMRSQVGSARRWAAPSTPPVLTNRPIVTFGRTRASRHAPTLSLTWTGLANTSSKSR